MLCQLIVSPLSRTAQQKHDNNETFVVVVVVVHVRAPFSFPAARVGKKRLWAGQVASGPRGKFSPPQPPLHLVISLLRRKKRGCEPSSLLLLPSEPPSLRRERAGHQMSGSDGKSSTFNHGFLEVEL